MEKPGSIKRFERFWWGSLILALLVTRASWDRVRNSIDERFAADPRLSADPSAALVADWAQWAGLAVVLLWTLLVWFLVSRRSVAGRWLAVVSAVLSGVQLLILFGGLAVGRTFHPFSHLVGTAVAVLTILAAAALFRPDARAWFGDTPEAEELPS